jgi:signal transduction histidine kinase
MSVDLNTIKELFLVVVIILSLVLGLSILLANRQSKKHIFFFLSCVSMIFWVTFGDIIYIEAFRNYLTPIGRANLLSVALFLVFIHGFVANYPEDQAKWRKIDIVYMAAGILLAIITSFSPFVVKEIRLSGSDRIWDMGLMMYPYYAYAISTTFIVVARLLRRYVGSSDIDKIKIRYFFSGLLILGLSNIVFNVLVPLFFSNDGLYWLGDFSLIFLLAFTGYAIVKYRAFNIKLIATETIVIVLSILLLVESFTFNNNSTEFVLKLLVWIIATYAGLQLVKSVRKEIEQKEKLAALSKELEKANLHLKEIDKLKDDFLSMASHELNTPIAAIEGYLSMILQEGIGGKIPAKTREYLESVFLSSQRLAHLVKDLLNVSRIESGRIHIIYEQKQVEDIIDQAIMEVMSKAREAKHTLTFVKPKKKMPMTWIDVTRITEILINIMGNSIKYTPNGGKITVKCVNDDEKIVVSVEDNGKGIPKERAKAVFEKFTQVDVMKDEVKGTGLGMYIAKKFIELMHGKIWFKSDGAGKGSTFYFSLPILKNKPFDPHEGEDAVLH